MDKLFSKLEKNQERESKANDEGRNRCSLADSGELVVLVWTHSENGPISKQVNQWQPKKKEAKVWDVMIQRDS